MPPSVLTRLRKACLALPEAHEAEAWGTPTFRVKNKLFAMYASGETHVGKGRNGVWIKSTSGNQELLLRVDPKRFFFPPYVGKGGWIGVYLDAKTDWKGLASLLDDGWQLTAPKKLIAARAAPPSSRARR